MRHARVVAQAPGWQNNPAVVAAKKAYDRAVAQASGGNVDSLAKENVDAARVNHESEFKKDPLSMETAVATIALQAALNAYYSRYKDEL